MTTKQTIAAATLCLGLATASAQAAPFYTFSGPGVMGAADTWGGSNRTNTSVILEVLFDFTTAADNAAGALLLWEAGDTSGSSLTIKGNNLLLASRHNNVLEVVEAAHGLTSPASNVQVVSVIDLTTDTMTVYVNGSSIGSGDKLQNDWSGGNNAHLGTSTNLNETGARPHSFYAGWGSISNYPSAASANFSFNAYLLGDGTGGTVTVESVLVPEPSSLALLGLGGLLIARRRRG